MNRAEVYAQSKMRRRADQSERGKAAGLKPCPFCGETPDEPIDACRVLGVWRIAHNCFVGSLNVQNPDRDACIEKWNTRKGGAQ